eukprot:GFYU01003615.1.p1 GENE.GFYU01003615.1~~GFYU01003615.1.p1  ORF type:complete len:328 (-),score=40.75 GFYU01003615.1:229-1212(-)
MKVLSLTLAAVFGIVGATTRNSDLFRGWEENVESFGRTPILMADDVNTITDINDAGGKLYYLANDASDFNIYALDLSNPEGESVIVAQSPGNPQRLAVYGGKLYWTTGPNLFACDLQSHGACSSTSPPKMIHMFDHTVSDLHVSASGTFFVGQSRTQNLYRGNLRSDGTIIFTLWTTLDEMMTVTSSDRKVYACCKVTGQQDQGSIVQIPEDASAPVPPSDVKVMWERQYTYTMHASASGNIWWVSGTLQNPLRRAQTYQPVMYDQIPQIQSPIDIASAAAFGYQPLVSTAAGILQCTNPSCQRSTVWNSSVTAYRMVIAAGQEGTQ